jgi:DNA repair protein RadC
MYSATFQGIKSWAENDRPREKFIQFGRNTLSDAELLAIVIGSGTCNESAVQLSQRILAEANHNLNALAKLNIAELQRYKGIGTAKAVAIAAAMELGRRRNETDSPKITKITRSQDAFAICKRAMMDLDHEEFRVLFLSRGNTIIQEKLISSGGISGTVVDTRLILKYALDCLASSLILLHNHPSGNPKPSQEDILITKKIKDAAKLMDIQILDHLIIYEKTYLSFADEGIL